MCASSPARIKAIGHVICERDPDAAEARDARILAEGGGKPRTITRQEIVPPLQRGLLATAAHAANGTLFPQPWVGTRGGTAIARCRLRHRLAAGARRRQRRCSRAAPLTIRRATRECRSSVSARRRALRRRTLAEESGIVARWFDRHDCSAAIVRPDHYVYGVAQDAPSLCAMLSELSTRLQ